jgi:hypothetical protein
MSEHTKVRVEFELDGPGTDSWDEVDVEVEFDFTPYCKPIYSGPMMGPGCDASVDLLSITYEGRDVRPQMSDNDLDRIEDACFSKMGRDEEAYWDAIAEDRAYDRENDLDLNAEASW